MMFRFGGWGGDRVARLRLTLIARLAIVAAVTLVLVATLPWMLRTAGAGSIDLLALPVAAVGALFGTAAAFAAVPVALAGMAALSAVLGQPLDWFVNGPHAILIAALALGFGGLSDVLRAARAQARLLEGSEQTLRTVLANAPLVLGAIDTTGRFTVREGRALSGLSLAPGEHLAEDARIFWREQYPEAPELPGYLDRALAGETVRALVRMRGRVFDVVFTPVLEHGARSGTVFVAVDVTEREAAERLSARSEARLDAIVSSALDAIITVDADGRVVLFNAAAERMFGCSAVEMLGSGLERLLPHDGGAAHAQQVERYMGLGSGAHEIARARPLMARRASGEEFPVELTLSRAVAEGEPLATVIVRDMSEKRKRDAELQHLALYDQLTDLPNRTLFQDRVGQAVASAKRDGSSFAVLLADLDNFTDTNVVLGQDAGDAVLREVASRLRGAVRDVDTVARFGGDEFAVLLPGAPERSAVEVAERILNELRRPLQLDDRPVDLSASLGIAVSPDHAADAQALVSRAEVAMYHAKRERRTYRVYAPDGREPPVDVTLVADLRRAIEGRELELAFQPEVCLRRGVLLRVEGLVRWTHPDLGPMAASRSIALAERSGLIGALTRHVLESGLDQMARWRAGGHDVQLALNLSARDLADATVPTFVAELLRRHRLPPSSLLLEITETALLTDLDQVRKRLRLLRDLGIGIAIDDFGTGYSSLSYLSSLPVSEVKIDRSFIRRMGSDAGALAVVSAAISLAHDLGLTVVAEGVERRAQLDRLMTLGCDAAQGYYLGRPLAAAEVPAWLRRSTFLSSTASASPLVVPVLHTA